MTKKLCRYQLTGNVLANKNVFVGDINGEAAALSGDLYYESQV
jgi:hypothetical protein